MNANITFFADFFNALKQTKRIAPRNNHFVSFFIKRSWKRAKTLRSLMSQLFYKSYTNEKLLRMKMDKYLDEILSRQFILKSHTDIEKGMNAIEQVALHILPLEENSITKIH